MEKVRLRLGSAEKVRKKVRSQSNLHNDVQKKCKQSANKACKAVTPFSMVSNINLFLWLDFCCKSQSNMIHTLSTKK